MRIAPVSIALLLLSSCATTPATPDPKAQFFTRLRAYCGQAFAGRIASPPVAADSAFAGKPLVMHVRECTRDRIRIPFHVGEDHSRTWVIMRAGSDLRLKHDHRHEDGSEDEITQYGGDTTAPGTSERQEFPADPFTRELLIQSGNSAGVENIWALELRPDRLFAYELRRPGRFFRVEFDLSRPVAEPPAPWGSR